jgi:hypothetical protein
MSFTNPFSVKVASTSTVGATEINNAGTDIERAVDGTGGGLYEPSPLIEFGGDGIEVSTDLLISGTETVTGTQLFNGGTQVIDATSAVTWQAGSIVAIASTSSITGATTFSGTTIVSGTTTLSGTTTQSGAFTRTGAETLSGSGGTTAYRVDTASITDTSSPQTITVGADLYVIGDGHTNDLDIRLSSSGAATGMKIRITRIHGSTGARDVLIRTAAPATLITFENASTASWAEFVFYGSAWHLSAFFSDSYTVA